MSFQLKLFMFLSANIEEENYTQIEDVYGNKVITFLIADDLAISFFFDGNNNLIAVTKVD